MKLTRHRIGGRRRHGPGEPLLSQRRRPLLHRHLRRCQPAGQNHPAAAPHRRHLHLRRRLGAVVVFLEMEGEDEAKDLEGLD